MNVAAVITIGMNPIIFEFGTFLLSWHGLFTFVAVAVSVLLVYRWATRQGMAGDPVLSICTWCIIGGIIGARLLHIIDFWSAYYQHDPIRLLYVWQGGIAIYGAILGGFAGGALYITIRNSDWFLSLWSRAFRWMGEPRKAQLPEIGRMADIAAPALLISMAIGRIGDVINGEHFAKATELPWGVFYSHVNSPGVNRPVSHPAVAYEIILDLLILAAIWPLRNRLRPHGMVFILYGALYAVGRFFLSFVRVEANTYFLGLNEAQIVSIIIMAIAIPWLVFRARVVTPSSP